MTICIIPARSGSKRIKNKNIKKINNRAIISYTIKTAIKSKLFSRVIVSTDSKRIANIAISYGAEVPFFRSNKLSDDHTSTKDVIIDCIKNISSEKTPYHFCIYPTASLLEVADLKKAFNKIKKKNFDFLVATSEFNYSPLRAFKILNREVIKFNSEKYLYSRSQDIPRLIHDSGTFYIYKTKSLLVQKKSLPSKTTFYMLERLKSLDINYPEDLKFAKYLHKYFKKK
tara:strand:- start:76 stop:759 length:684 start_codon:yes stop_codon:yes gene_type:complete